MGWKKLVLQAVTLVILAADTQSDTSEVYTGGTVLWLGYSGGVRVQRRW